MYLRIRISTYALLLGNNQLLLRYCYIQFCLVRASGSFYGAGDSQLCMSHVKVYQGKKSLVNINEATVLYSYF